MFNVLIDAGATRNCISEFFYHLLGFTHLKHLFNVNVKSANLQPLGLVSYPFT